MTEPTLLHKAEKPARPPHVIVLADVMRRLSSVPKLDALVVLWAIPAEELGTDRVGSAGVGNDTTMHFLASRFCHRVISGEIQKGPVPQDTP